MPRTCMHARQAEINSFVLSWPYRQRLGGKVYLQYSICLMVVLRNQEAVGSE